MSEVIDGFVVMSYLDGDEDYYGSPDDTKFERICDTLHEAVTFARSLAKKEKEITAYVFRTKDDGSQGPTIYSTTTGEVENVPDDVQVAIVREWYSGPPGSIGASGAPGLTVEGYDGKQTWATINSQTGTLTVYGQAKYDSPTEKLSAWKLEPIQ